MSQLHLSLLGTPVVKHGEHILTFSTRKALALLVYLATPALAEANNLIGSPEEISERIVGPATRV